MTKYTTSPDSEADLIKRASRLLSQLARCLAKIPDPRDPRGVRYPLWQILALVVLGKLAFQETPTAIAEWAYNHRDTIVPLLGFKNDTVPHHDTIRRLLNRLNPSLVDAAVGCFAHQIAEASKSDSQALSLLAFDGKSLRSTRLEDGYHLHLLAAFEPKSGLVYRQVRVEQGKENETSSGLNFLNGKLKFFLSCQK